MMEDADELHLTDIGNSIRIIPLESSDLCWIGKLVKVQMTDNQIFVSSKNSVEGGAPELFSFNNSGDFIFKIGRYGKGPGEYTSMLDFTISKKDTSLIILDYKKILQYDLDGKFIRSIKLETKEKPFLPTRIEILANGDILCEGSGTFQLGIFENSGKLKKCFTNINNININLQCPFTFYEEKVLVNVLFEDTVYTLNQEIWNHFAISILVNLILIFLRMKRNQNDPLDNYPKTR